MKRKGIILPEEISFRKGWINAGQLEALAAPMMKNSYGQYLSRTLKEKIFR